jgi:hypothetical protein
MRAVLLLVPGVLAVALGVNLFGGTASVRGSGWELVKDESSLAFSAPVVATGAHSAWSFGWIAEGWLWDNSTHNPTAFGWDGNRWNEVQLPSAAHGDPSAADASGPDDVWAGATGDDTHPAVALRWDGHTWTVARSLPEMSTINDVTVAGPQDAWYFGTDRSGQGVAWHHTLQGWTGAAVPLTVFRADARAANDIWAIGDSTVAHYDGRTWRDVPVNSSPATFIGIAAADDDVWISAWRDGGRDTVLLHYTEKGWQEENVTRTVGRFRDTIRPVPDGKGGLWLIGSTDENGYESALAHRSAAGVWTRTPIHPSAEISYVTRVPGTGQLLATGTFGDGSGVLLHP